MTTKKPDTLATLARAVLREAGAAAADLAEAEAKALSEKTAAQEALCRAEAAWGAAMRARTMNGNRAAAAAALARLASHPELIDALLSQPLGGDHCEALKRRGLVYVSQPRWRESAYYYTRLGADVCDLARELRDRLSAPE